MTITYLALFCVCLWSLYTHFLISCIAAKKTLMWFTLGDWIYQHLALHPCPEVTWHTRINTGFFVPRLTSCFYPSILSQKTPKTESFNKTLLLSPSNPIKLEPVTWCHRFLMSTDVSIEIRPNKLRATEHTKSACVNSDTWHSQTHSYRNNMVEYHIP